MYVAQHTEMRKVTKVKDIVSFSRLRKQKETGGGHLVYQAHLKGNSSMNPRTVCTVKDR